jgi:hypothetical protein
VSPSVDMLPFGVTIPATVPQGSEIPEGLMNNPIYTYTYYVQNIRDMGLNNLQVVRRARFYRRYAFSCFIFTHQFMIDGRRVHQSLVLRPSRVPGKKNDVNKKHSHKK